MKMINHGIEESEKKLENYEKTGLPQSSLRTLRDEQRKDIAVSGLL